METQPKKRTLVDAETAVKSFKLNGCFQGRIDLYGREIYVIPYTHDVPSHSKIWQECDKDGNPIDGGFNRIYYERDFVN